MAIVFGLSFDLVLQTNDNREEGHMARKIAIAAGIAVTLGTLLGLATAVAEETHRPPVMQLPRKSCSWAGSSAAEAVPSGTFYRNRDDNSLWKCNDGAFTCVRNCPRDTRPKG